MNWHVILPIIFLCHLTFSMPQNELRNSGKWKPDGSNGECGTRITSSNIVGGSITKLGDYPWMVLLGSPSVGFDNKVLIFCVEFRELSHLTHDLSQAEKKITVVTS